MSQHHKNFFVVTIAIFVVTLTFLVGTLFSAERPEPTAQEYSN
jgi:hypothetical protein